MHPFLRNWKSFIIYLAVWVLIAAAHTAFLHQFSDAPAWILMSDSIFSMFFLAFLMSGLWYTVRFGVSRNQSAWMQTLRQIGAALLVLSFWGFISYVFLNLLGLADENYSGFLLASIPWRIALATLLYGITIMIYYVIAYYQSIQEHATQSLELSNLLKETQLRALRSQINPHFLFNSLNSISSLTISDSAKAREMVIKLSEFLRYSLKQENEGMTSLENELYHLKQYLEIEKIRFGARLVPKQNCSDESLQKQLPVMLLQPLVENAVKHGVNNSLEPVTISVSCFAEGENLKVIVGNSYSSREKKRPGTGTGLRNIRERLSLLYMRSDLVSINEKEDYFEVTILIPQNIQ